MDILLTYYVLWLFACAWHAKHFKKGVYHGDEQALYAVILGCAGFWFIWIPMEIATGIYKLVRGVIRK